MADNFVESGERISITAAQAYTKGLLYILGMIPAIALNDAAIGETAVFKAAGVWRVALNADASAVFGAPAYWDADNEELTDDPAFAQVGTFRETTDGATAKVALGGGAGSGGGDGGPEMAVVAHAFADGATLALPDVGRDMLVVVDTQAGAVEVDLFTAVGNAGRRLVFKRAGTGVNAITLDGNAAETIDGSATNATLDAANDSLEIISDGANWVIASAKLA